MTAGRKLISNSAFLFIDWLAITVLSLIFWVIIGKTLPKEIYGIVSTAINMIVILSGIALLGLNGALVKLIPEFAELNQYGKIRSLIKLSVKIGLLVGLAFAAAIGLLSPFLSDVLNLPADAVVMVGIGIFIFAIWGITTAIVQGFQNMKRIMKTNVIGNVLKVVLTLGFVLIGFTYLGPLAGLFLGIIAVIFLRIDTMLPNKKIKQEKGNSKLDLKSIFTYSLAALVSSIAMLGFSNTPNIILNALTNPAVTAIFAVSMTITSPLFTIPSVLNTALLPITSALSAQKSNRIRERTLINMVLRYASFITLPVIAILLAFAGTIILLFWNAEFLAAASLFPIMGVAAFLFGVGGILNISIYALKKPIVSRNIIFATLAVFFALSFPLSIMYEAMGMAIAYLITMVVFFVINLVYLKRFIDFSIDLAPILKVVVAVLIFYGILFGVDNIVSNEIIKFVGTVAAFVAYFFVLIPLKFYKKDDLQVLEFLAQKTPVGKKIFYSFRDLLEKYV